MKSFKDQSRIEWHNAGRQQVASIEDIQIGCLQRIADATEVMAKNNAQLQRERDQYKASLEYQREENDRLCRRITSLRGVITKLKKKAKQ